MTVGIGRFDRQVPTCTYRFRGAERRLIYVGVTEDLEERTRQHRRKHWWPLVVGDPEVIWFDNRLDALYEESRAIDTEDPLCNDRPGINPLGLRQILTHDPISGGLRRISGELAVTRQRKDAVLTAVRERGEHAEVTFERVVVGVAVPFGWYAEACRRLGEPSRLHAAVGVPV